MATERGQRASLLGSSEKSDCLPRIKSEDFFEPSIERDHVIERRVGQAEQAASHELAPYAPARVSVEQVSFRSEPSFSAIFAANL